MKTKITKAMILAAGEGTRLQPLTLVTPKPLLPIGNKPILVHQLEWLKSHGVSEVAINLYHIGEKIEHALDDGSQFGMTIHYSHEEQLLGTAGGLKKMQRLFEDDTFFVVYGDIFTTLNLSEMATYHRQKKALMTIALVPTEIPWEKGIIETDDNGRLVSFTEKPPKGTEKSSLSNAAVYVAEPGIFTYIPRETKFDFGFDVLPHLIRDDAPVYGYNLKPDDYWADIGTIDKYNQVNEDYQADRFHLNPTD